MNVEPITEEERRKSGVTFKTSSFESRSSSSDEAETEHQKKKVD